MNITATKYFKEYGRWLPLILLIFALTLLAGCGPAEEQDPEEGSNATEPLAATVTPPVDEATSSEESSSPAEPGAYPPPAQDPGTDASGAYPPPQEVLPAPDAYPGPEDAPDGIPLTLDRPISPGSSVVTGDGPPGLLIYIVNMTLMGEIVGNGRIGDDGRFSVTVSPLEENIRIGVASENGLRGLPDEGISPGEGEFSVPQVGYFYDSVVVR